MRARPDRGFAAAILLTAAAVAWFIVAARLLVFFYPPIWPDEGLFADAAWSLASRGTLASPLMAGVLPGIESHTYWVPPAYFLYLAAWLRLFGPGVAVIRGASFALGLVMLALVFRIAARTDRTATRTGAALAVAVLATHPAFLRASLVARMDLLSLTAGLAAAWTCSGWLRSRTATRLAAATVLAVIALAAHPLGLVPVAIVLATAAAAPATPAGRGRAVVLAVAIIMAAVAMWLWYGSRDWTAFVSQLAAQMHRKSVAGGLPHRAWVLWTWLAPQPAARIVSAVLLAAAGAALLVDVHRDRTTMPLCAVALAYPAAALVGGEGWYAVYLMPAAALGIAALSRLRVPALAIALAAVAVCAGAASERGLIVQARQHDYRAWAAAVRRTIAAQPPGTTVMLDSIPDPWPALVGHDIGAHVVQAPPEGIAPETLDASIARASLVITSDDIVSLTVLRRLAASGEWRMQPVATVGGYLLQTWTRVARQR